MSFLSRQLKIENRFYEDRCSLIFNWAASKLRRNIQTVFTTTGSTFKCEHKHCLHCACNFGA